MNIQRHQILTDEDLSAIKLAYVGESATELDQLVEWATLASIDTMTFALLITGRLEVAKMRGGEPVFNIRREKVDSAGSRAPSPS